MRTHEGETLIAKCDSVGCDNTAPASVAGGTFRFPEGWVRLVVYKYIWAGLENAHIDLCPGCANLLLPRLEGKEGFVLTPMPGAR